MGIRNRTVDSKEDSICTECFELTGTVSRGLQQEQEQQDKNTTNNNNNNNSNNNNNNNNNNRTKKRLHCSLPTDATGVHVCPAELSRRASFSRLNEMASIFDAKRYCCTLPPTDPCRRGMLDHTHAPRPAGQQNQQSIAAHITLIRLTRLPLLLTCAAHHPTENTAKPRATA